MGYPNKKRDFHSYFTGTIPDGLYIDHNTGQCFVSTRRLAKLVDEFDGTIDHFIEEDSVLQGSMEIAVVQTAMGLKCVRVHPQSTVRAVVKEFQPDTFDVLEEYNLGEFLDRLSKLPTYSRDESVHSKTEWTLHEWMARHCEIVLADKLFNQFKSKVHRAYKETYREDPRTSYRKQAKNPKQVARLHVYTPNEFPVLQLCYMKTLMEVRCS
jgi:hypothetical protein